MGTKTKIEWADSTWSPWRGCTKVSPGCRNCYAETLAKRNPAVMGGWGNGATRVLAKNWQEPMRWQKRTSMDMPHPRVFPSLCDWLDDEVPVEWLARFLTLIWETPSVDWLLLTKRPQKWGKRLRAAHCATTGPIRIALAEWLDGTPPVNVWFGISVEDQTRAEERIALLLEIPAELRWLSVEPLLGPVDLSEWTSISIRHHIDGSETTIPNPIDWVVVGGESGPKARPCNVEWIQSVIYDCKNAGIPCFVKQIGSRPKVEAPRGGWMQPVHVLDRKGGDPDEWPSELRVRQFPSPSL